MSMYKNLNYTEVLRILYDDGWIIEKQVGSHIHLKHPTKPGKVTVPNRGNKVIPIGTLRSILKQAGLL